MKKNLEIIIAVGIIIGMVFAAMQLLAWKSEVQAVDKKVDNHIVTQQIYETRRLMNQLEEINRKYGEQCNNWPNARDRNDYRRLKQQLEGLQHKRQQLLSK